MTIKEEKCIIYIYKLTQILQQSTNDTSATDSVWLFVSIYKRYNGYKFISSFKQWCLTLGKGVMDPFENQRRAANNKTFPSVRIETHTHQKKKFTYKFRSFLAPNTHPASHPWPPVPSPWTTGQEIASRIFVSQSFLSFQLWIISSIEKSWKKWTMNTHMHSI